MLANPVLLQKKYARVIEAFADRTRISLSDALAFFYKSVTYKLISKGISDMHCRSDEYLVDELCSEMENRKVYID